MRCLSCNRILSDQEATRRGASSGDFLDLCNHCYSTIAESTPTIESPLFESDSDADESEAL